MGRIKRYHLVKLITGFIFADESALIKAKSILKKYFGQTDFESVILPFTHSDYYTQEFGKGLKRQFISFNKLIPAEKIADIKILSNKIEERLAFKHGPRKINIDPGYLDMAKLILATTKDFAHRIYLKKGILSEITLCYRNKSFSPWEWTYPDYRTAEYLNIFNKIRDIYAQQTKS